MSDELKRFLANARGTAATAKVLSLDELDQRRGAEKVEARWGLAPLRGRLVELSARGASATLTAAGAGAACTATAVTTPSVPSLPMKSCFRS